MTPAQARALLALIADLYQLASTQKQPPVMPVSESPAPVANNKKETASASS